MRTVSRIIIILVGIVLSTVGLFGSVAHAAPQRAGLPQSHHQAGASSILGRWVSVQCEARPNAQYVKRDFKLAKTQWELDQLIYADAACTQPTLNFHVEGSYVLGNPSTVLPGATEAEFTLATVKLTPRVQATADFLNTAPAGTCGAARWELGVEQDLGPTKGCALFGLDLTNPIVEYDVVKVEGKQLFFGARPQDGGFLNTPERRPTSFAEPLARQAAAPPQGPKTLPATGAGSSSSMLVVGIAHLLILFGAATTLTLRAGQR
jgi:hypothetical protein